MPAATLHILEEAKELPVRELDRLIASLAALRAHKIATPISEREEELLEDISTVVPLTLRNRWIALLEAQQERDLSEQERTQLIFLADAVEAKEAERAELLAELARLRGVSIFALVEQLGLRPRDRETA